MNPIDFKSVGLFSAKVVKRLYKSAFPANERMPFYLLRLSAMRNQNNDFWALEQNGQTVGLLYVVRRQTMGIIGYFAIAESHRSAGLGAEALNALKQRFPRLHWLLNIEVLDKAADNYPQWCRRRQFYQRHAFHMLPYTLAIGGTLYALLATDGTLERAAILAMYREFSWGADLEVMPSEFNNLLFESED
ncbi:GNAT family N-acetyltransferase [Testudinibacter sp. TR-2022]|uniref:GNAT family N-acetyltransferase n=1 Tax=Testudinibacter sp. TR-2022 TaxID=2585029 RepID=UPI00159BC870|nr:GNAT family N-acetyltransferase [Testudinibacter sp. TR-2022]